MLLEIVDGFGIPKLSSPKLQFDFPNSSFYHKESMQHNGSELSKGMDGRKDFILLVRTLHDLGVCYDEHGRLRNERTGEYITRHNLHGDPSQFVNAITNHVLLKYTFIIHRYK